MLFTNASEGSSHLMCFRNHAHYHRHDLEVTSQVPQIMFTVSVEFSQQMWHKVTQISGVHNFQASKQVPKLEGPELIDHVCKPYAVV